MWIGPRDHKKVGTCLEAVRRDAGVTQQDLALRLGKPQSFVSAYEAGQRRVDVLEFIRIVSVLGGDPREVLARILAMSDEGAKRP